jgi:hypothetical protein
VITRREHSTGSSLPCGAHQDDENACAAQVRTFDLALDDEE